MRDAFLHDDFWVRVVNTARDKKNDHYFQHNPISTQMLTLSQHLHSQHAHSQIARNSSFPDDPFDCERIVVMLDSENSRADTEVRRSLVDVCARIVRRAT